MEIELDIKYAPTRDFDPNTTMQNVKYNNKKIT